jgi:phosphoglucosamine mutase
VLVNVRVVRKQPLEELPQVLSLIGKIERALGAGGRVLVRYSGTEAKARVMVEGPDPRTIQSYAEDIARTLEKACA